MCVVATALACPAIATAQDSRTDVITREQAEKAKTAAPYTPGKGEALLIYVQKLMSGSYEGVYPAAGSVYSGGGFTLGAGYRRFVSDRNTINLLGLYSLSSYKLIDFTFNSPRSPTGRVEYSLSTGWRDATQVAYYGLGIDSPESRSNFRLKQTYVGGNLSVRPLWWTVLRGAATYEDYNMEDGRGTAPSIFDVHTPATAPGLEASPTYFHTVASAGIDWRPAAGYARQGGLYELAYHRYNDSDDTYTFDRVDGTLVQHLPILRENWILSLRGQMQTTIGDEDIVPYFLLPSLGSGDTLRAYTSWRFRDRHSLLMSAEWRWVVNRMAMDMAIFYDAGTVAARRSDLGFSNMESDVGIGVRFHSPVATPLRIELARGREGFNIVFSGKAAF